MELTPGRALGANVKRFVLEATRSNSIPTSFCVQSRQLSYLLRSSATFSATQLPSPSPDTAASLPAVYTHLVRPDCLATARGLTHLASSTSFARPHPIKILALQHYLHAYSHQRSDMPVSETTPQSEIPLETLCRSGCYGNE